MKHERILLAAASLLLPACCGAQAPAPMVNGLECSLNVPTRVAVVARAGVRTECTADGAEFITTLLPGRADGRACLGPVRLPPGAATLRFTAALTVPDALTCELLVRFSSAGTARDPATVPYSSYAARAGGVFQDVFIPVAKGADSATLELRLTAAEAGEAALRLRYPCVTVEPAAREPEQTEDGGVLFRQSFSHPDGRADYVKGAVGVRPAWACALPTARGKSGPGLRAEYPHEALHFVLPEEQVLGHGVLTFWLQPLWAPGDACPADMVKISQRGGPRILVRKNHGWSFLFVVWDQAGKTHGASCDLRNLTRDQWTRVEATWDAAQGLRLMVNGVVLGSNDCTWPPPVPASLAVRLGQGEHDKPERAPYVLDEVELRTDVPKGAL